MLNKDKFCPKNQKFLFNKATTVEGLLDPGGNIDFSKLNDSDVSGIITSQCDHYKEAEQDLINKKRKEKLVVWAVVLIMALILIPISVALVFPLYPLAGLFLFNSIASIQSLGLLIVGATKLYFIGPLYHLKREVSESETAFQKLTSVKLSREPKNNVQNLNANESLGFPNQSNSSQLKLTSGAAAVDDSSSPKKSSSFFISSHDSSNESCPSESPNLKSTVSFSPA